MPTSTSGPARRGAPPPSPVIPGRVDGLGTFAGVFTPSILTILGVIMYLRFGWVVGNVGLLGTLAIVTVSTGITFLTALSVAAIATDQRVRIGGAYYMISRSLGLETGGAVGIPLYIAQGLSVALYTVGFAESVVGVFPALSPRSVGIATTVAVTALALVSARAAIRAQYVIMAAIAVSLLSLVAGGPVDAEPMGLLGTPAEGGEGFWTVFAVFFPAVTGIMAGVNMSGDLAEPGKSIPRGTFAAVGVGYLVYMSVPLLLVSLASAETLVSDPLVMRRMAFWGDAILLGVWGATLSSAVGSILGAPRVLQALARDGVLPRPLRWLGRGSGADDAPRLGTVVTLLLALVAVWFGDLNLIAPVLTMFFLTTYGILNVAAGIERFLGSPSFRPRFEVHWLLSLLGALGCVAVMFLINASATVVALGFVLVVFLWLERQGLQSAWGDVRQGLWMALARTGVLRLRPQDDDPRNWRPHFLVLSGAPRRRWHQVELADALSHSRGLLTVAVVVPDDAMASKRRRRMEVKIRDYMAKRGVEGLARVMAAPDRFVGALRLVEAYGLGSLTPNTVLIGASETVADRERYCHMLGELYHHQRNVLVVRVPEEEELAGRGRIDIWWGGLQGNGSLLMILGYLLRTSLPWRGADARLVMVVPTEKAAAEARANLERMVEATRTGVRPELIVADDGRRPLAHLRETSADADLVIMGLRAPDGSFDYRAYYDDIMERTAEMPPTLYVLAAEEVAFRDVLLREPDE
jgi:amino acid transporter